MNVRGLQDHLGRSYSQDLIDIQESDKAVLAEVDKLWERLRHVGMGKRMANEPASLQLTQD
jgi:hypothetical protein